MRVNFVYLLEALHMEGVEGDASSTRETASRVLDYLYTDTGYRAFVAIVRALVEQQSKQPKQKPQSRAESESSSSSSGSSSGMGDVPAGVDEDQFATLMRRMTDYRDWQIVDLFTLFDREGDSIIRTSDLFIFVALLVSTEARRSSFVFYLHRQDIFELFSRSALPRGIDDDDALSDSDGGSSNDGGDDNSDNDDDNDDDYDSSDDDDDDDDDGSGGRAGTAQRGRPHRSVSVGSDDARTGTRTRTRTRAQRPVALDTSVRLRDEGGVRASPVSPETPAHTPPSPLPPPSPTLLACPTIGFAQFCGVGIMLGMDERLLVSVLKSFGLREDSDFPYQDFLVYAYWILAHMDAKDDAPDAAAAPRP